MSHPLDQGSGGVQSSSSRSQVSKKKTAALDDDSTGTDTQCPAIKDLDLAPSVDGGNVPDDPSVEDSVSLNRPAVVFDDVSTGQTGIHDNPFAAAGNDDEARIDNRKTKLIENVSEVIISRVFEEDFDECPESGSFEKRGEGEGEMAEAPSEGQDDSEVPAQIDESDDEDEFPGLCAYEKLRERNIRERKEFLKDVMEEIDDAKQHMYDNAPKKRKADDDKLTKPKRRRIKEVEPVEVRRSKRAKKPVSYVDDEDCDGTGRNVKPSVLPNPRPSKKHEEPLSSPPEDQGCSSRSLRPRKPVCYTEFPEPDTDSYIWCSGCDRMEYHGCETHVTLFGDNNMFNLQVGKSAIKARNAGQGIFNRGDDVIPEGTLFGPYTGTFIPITDYEQLEKEGKESGNAWEVKDKDGKRVVGYVDPGINPDPSTHWMSKVNCAMNILGQNLVGFQLAGQIYYRAMQDIPPGRELLVFYGGSYATGLGIDVKKYERFSGEEDQTEDAVVCEFCHIGMGSEELVKGHGCREKKDAEMIRMAQTGERKWICNVCGKGFKTKSIHDQHGVVHSKVKAYMCPVEGCNKAFSQSYNLTKHKKTVHEGVYYECEECGRRFGVKHNMSRHFQTVHLQEKRFKCPTCGIKFARKQDLKRHVMTVHDLIKSFECEHCGKSFGQACSRKEHIEAVHLGIRYSCTWRGGCGYSTGQKQQVPFHIRRVHTKEWSWECQLCEDQKGIWWGCIHPGEMEKHKAKNHPVEWEEEQETYRKEHPHVCKVKKCEKRFATKVEVDRHFMKLH